MAVATVSAGAVSRSSPAARRARRFPAVKSSGGAAFQHGPGGGAISAQAVWRWRPCPAGPGSRSSPGTASGTIVSSGGNEISPAARHAARSARGAQTCQRKQRQWRDTVQRGRRSSPAARRVARSFQRRNRVCPLGGFASGTVVSAAAGPSRWRHGQRRRLNGGRGFIYSGGTAIGAVVSSGGSEFVSRTARRLALVSTAA